MNKWIHRNLGAFRLLLIDYDCKYNIDFISVGVLLTHKIPITFHKGLGCECISIVNCAIRGKLDTPLQAFTLNPCTKFPQIPRKVDTEELTSQHCLNRSMYAFIYCIRSMKKKDHFSTYIIFKEGGK